MLAARCLLALALLAAASCEGPYEAVQFKGKRELKPTKIRGLYIPDGQCSGVAERTDYGCGSDIISVYAHVADAVQPDVSVRGDLARVTVRRARDGRGRCAGRVVLDLRVACLFDRRPRMLRRAAPLALPPAQDTLQIPTEV